MGSGNPDLDEMFAEMESARDVERDKFGILAEGVPALKPGAGGEI